MDGDCAAGGGSGVGFDLATHVQPDVVAGGVGGRSGFIVAVFPDVCPGRAERRIVVVADAGAARLDAPFFRLALPMVANWMTARMARAAAVATAVAAAATASTAGTTSAAPLPAEIEFKDAQSGESHPPTTSSFTKGHTDEGKEGGIN